MVQAKQATESGEELVLFVRRFPAALHHEAKQAALKERVLLRDLIVRAVKFEVARINRKK